MKERATIICRHEGKVLFVRRAKAKWNLPGGKLEAGESALQAALRELDEEVGVSPPALDFVAQYQGDKVLHHLFETTLANAYQALPQNEIAQCKWLTPKQLDKEPLATSVKALVLAYLRPRQRSSQ